MPERDTRPEDKDEKTDPSYTTLFRIKDKEEIVYLLKADSISGSFQLYVGETDKLERKSVIGVTKFANGRLQVYFSDWTGHYEEGYKVPREITMVRLFPLDPVKRLRYKLEE